MSVQLAQSSFFYLFWAQLEENKAGLHPMNEKTEKNRFCVEMKVNVAYFNICLECLILVAGRTKFEIFLYFERLEPFFGVMTVLYHFRLCYFYLGQEQQ